MLLLAALLVSPARAEEKPPYDKHVSITLSPVHLFLPFVEVTGEGRVLDKLGVAGIAGVGATQGYSLFEVGAQGRYYAVGSFDHGMELGAEALVIRAGGSPSGATASGVGVSVGPFIGYKIAARFGLTFDMQVGVQYSSVSAQASNGSTTETAQDGGLAPLVNLNLGWSF